MLNEVTREAGWLRKSLFWVFRKSVKPFYGRGFGQRLPVAALKLFSLLIHLLSVGLRPRTIMVEVGGIKLYLDSKMAPGIIMSGTYEKGTTRLFRDLAKEGMVILDIGANVGYYSLLTARLVGEKGKVFAFEPAPDNFALLMKNIEVNGFSNIIPVQKAVSNKTGKGRLFLSGDADSHSMLYEHHGKGSIEVEVTSVDEFTKNINHPVDLVKMDVEGWEMRVLEGDA